MEPIFAQQNIEWREVGELPSGGDWIYGRWPRNASCPREGKTRWIRNFARSSDRKVDETITERGWLLFNLARPCSTAGENILKNWINRLWWK